MLGNVIIGNYCGVAVGQRIEYISIKLHAYILYIIWTSRHTGRNRQVRENGARLSIYQRGQRKGPAPRLFQQKSPHAMPEGHSYDPELLTSGQQKTMTTSASILSTCPFYTNGGCGKREEHINWSMVTCKAANSPRNLVSEFECGRAFPAGVEPGSSSRDETNWLSSRLSRSAETRGRYGWLRMVLPGALREVSARERQGALSRRAW